MKKEYLLVVVFFIQTKLALSQNSAFQISHIPIPFGGGIIEVAVNNQDSILGIIQPPSVTGGTLFYMLPIEKKNVLKAQSFDFPEYFDYIPPSTIYFDNQLLISFKEGFQFPPWIFHYNTQTQTNWCRKIYKPQLGFHLGSITSNNSGEFIVTATHDGSQFYPPFDTISVLSFDNNGQLLSEKGLEYSIPGLITPYLRNIKHVVNRLDGTQYMLINADFNFSTFKRQFIVKLDKNCEPIDWKMITTDDYNQLFLGKDGIYLMGKSKQLLPFGDPLAHLVLSKLDFNLNAVWTNIYSGTYFENYEGTFRQLSNGNMVLGLTAGFAVYTPFPCIVAKLDENGHVLSQKGYGLIWPELDILSDGSVLMHASARVDSTGKIIDDWIIAKTDSLGELNGCATFPSCLVDYPGSIAFDQFSLESVADSCIITNFDVVEDSLDYSFEDFCDENPLPSPDFVMKDSICLGENIATKTTRNVLAAKRIWEIKGIGLDTIIVDSLNIQFTPTVAGKYKISQKIWVLGCEYENEHVLTVLEPLKMQLAVDSSTICTPPTVLFAVANRPLRNYLWNNNDQTPTIPIFENGAYFLTASDGFCVAFDTLQIQFISVSGGHMPIKLPADTTICEQSLPFLLKPTSFFAQKFSLSADFTNQDSLFLLTKKGKYEIFVDVAGCPFSAFFELKTEDCLPKIYFPNVFSPNGDGFNDEFEPKGTGFQAVKLSIFDRWGNLWFENSTQQPAWKGENAQNAVYTFVFEYINLFDAQKNIMSGSISLAR